MYQAPEVGQEISDEEFKLLVFEQFRDIAQSFRKVLPKVYTAEPTKPFDALIVVADGTNWNPGSGAGYYGYYNGSWTFLG